MTRILLGAIKTGLLWLALGLNNTALAADGTLTFSYWDEASEPLVIIKNDVLAAGIVKEVGDALAQALDKQAIFKRLPVKRIEPYLREGELDFDCVTSPIWKEQPESYHWSPPLFRDNDLFLVRSGADSDIRSFNDLIGKQLGVYQGYTYHPDIMKLIKSGDVEVTKISDLDKGIHLLELRRIDALIEFGLILRHRFKQNSISADLTIASHPADTFELMCAYSPKLQIEQSRIEQAFDKLIKQGTFENVLSQY